MKKTVAIMATMLWLGMWFGGGIMEVGRIATCDQTPTSKWFPFQLLVAFVPVIVSAFIWGKMEGEGKQP